MTTILELRERVGRMLSDPTLSGYDVGLFFDSLNAALDAILPWVPKTATNTITGSGAKIYTLPEDCYQVETCVVDADGELLPQAILIPGYYHGDSIKATNDWLEYPEGSISFSKEISVGETYTLYYLAHWTKPTEETEESTDLEPPEYTHYALTLYTTAAMLLPAAISAAEVRQYATKVDSGNPEHNPMMETSKYLLRLFVDEMNRHPKHQKAQK